MMSLGRHGFFALIAVVACVVLPSGALAGRRHRRDGDGEAVATVQLKASKAVVHEQMALLTLRGTVTVTTPGPVALLLHNLTSASHHTDDHAAEERANRTLVAVRREANLIEESSLQLELPDGLALQNVEWAWIDKPRPTLSRAAAATLEAEIVLEQARQAQQADQDAQLNHLASRLMASAVDDTDDNDGDDDDNGGDTDATEAASSTEAHVTKRLREIAEDRITLLAARRATNAKLAELRRLRDAVRGDDANGNNKRQDRVAKLHVQADKGTHVVNVTILVTNASWTPVYDLRIHTEAAAAKVDFGAHVRQASGFPWDGVALELCTGAPSTSVASVPTSEPLELSLESPRAAEVHWINREAGPPDGNVGRKRARSPTPEPTPAPTPVPTASASVTASATRSASRVQEESMDSVRAGTFAAASMDSDPPEAERSAGPEAAAPDAVRRPRPGAEVASTGVSDIFALPDPASIPSHRAETRVKVAAVTVKANVTYHALPASTTRTFITATLHNDSPFTFLAGKAMLFADGAFVAPATMPLVGSEGHATMTVGRDKRVVARRRLLWKDSKRTGGLLSAARMEHDLKYVASVENKKSVPVWVSIEDRVPVSKSPEIDVTLVAPAVEGSLRALKEPKEVTAVPSKPAGMAPVTAVVEPSGRVQWTLKVPPATTVELPLHFHVAHADGKVLRGLGEL